MEEVFLMKDLFLISIMLAVFVFGYFVMAKIDSFIEENRRLIHAENRQNRAHIRIAAESPMLLDSIAVQLTSYSRADPFVEFFLSSGKAERILQNSWTAHWISQFWQKITIFL